MDLDIYDLIRKYKDATRAEILADWGESERELSGLYNSAKYMEVFDRSEQTQFIAYLKDIQGFLYFLDGNGIPGIGVEGLRKFTPIIEHLITIGDMNSKAMDYLR